MTLICHYWPSAIPPGLDRDLAPDTSLLVPDMAKGVRSHERFSPAAISNHTPDLPSDVLDLTPPWLLSAGKYGPDHHFGPSGPGTMRGVLPPDS